MNRYSKFAIGLAALAVAAVASAQKSGDDVFSLGVAVMTQDISVGKLTSTGGSSSTAVTSALADSSASTSGATTISTSWLHMFTNNIATELTLGLPPRISLDFKIPNGASGGLSTSQPGAASADVLTPALVAKYLFNTPAEKLRPYVGLGASYVSFQNVTTSSGVSRVAGGGAKLDDTWAPVYNLGVIYNFSERWSVNASVSYIPIETKITMVSSSPTIFGTTTGTARFNTTDYVLRVGYRF